MSASHLQSLRFAALGLLRDLLDPVAVPAELDPLSHAAARCHGDAAMAANAEQQGEGEWTVFAITVAGSVASFVAVSVVLHAVKDMPPIERQLQNVRESAPDGRLRDRAEFSRVGGAVSVVAHHEERIQRDEH